MSTTTEYPQDAKLVKNRKPLKIALAIAASVIVITGGTWGGVAWASGVAAQRAHLETVALQHQVEQATPHLEAQTAAIGDESDTTSADQVVVAEQAREAAVLAAQEAAAEVAAKKAAEQGPIKCPAGTHAMAVDGNGNESNCDPLNGQGEQCEAYDANNQCTSWLKP